MSDIRDWGAFIRGRWDWTRHGYERGFPRGCGFTDVDAAIEFNGRKLIIETKTYDGEGAFPSVPNGQRRFLASLCDDSTTVLVLFGCGACNDPYGVLRISDGVLLDWRGQSRVQRRARLKTQIDHAMRVVAPVRFGS